jgi:repressor LexA
MEPLTPRQREALDFFIAFEDQRGITPTLREMGEALGIRSTNGVADLLKQLLRKGYIERAGDPRSSRSLRVSSKARGGFRTQATMAVPVVGRVAAGSPILAEENYAGALHIDSTMMPHDGPVFALVVQGNSMIDDGIFDGDYVFVRQQSTARNSEIVVAMVDGEATVKRFFQEGTAIRLEPANVEMKPIIVDPTRQFQLVGVVCGVYRRLRV